MLNKAEEEMVDKVTSIVMTVIVGSILIIIVGLTLKFLFWLF